MNRRAFGILAVLSSVAGLADSCKRRAKVPSERPPAEREADPATSREVEISVIGDDAFSVLVIATDERGAEERIGPVSWLEQWGGWTDTLTYTSGLKIRVEVRVTPGKRGSRARISIADGRWNRVFARNDLEDGSVRLGPLTAFLTTSR